MQATNINNLGKGEKNKKVKSGDCIFPFKYKWKMHDKCFPTDKGEICATEINPKTKTLIKYGYCVKNKTKKVKKVKKVKKLKLVALTKTKKLKKTKTKTKSLKKKQNMTKKSKKLKLVKSLKLKSKKMNNEKVYNEEFASILGELQSIMMRTGEPFRARAYRKAANTIMTYTEDITDTKQLEGLPGIGKTIMSKLNEYVKTGKLRTIEKYRNDPINVLTKVYGIGPKKAKAFAAKGIDTIEKLRQHPELLTAAQKLGVQYFDDIEMRIPRQEINTYEGVMQKIFKESAPTGSKFEIVGSFRRGDKTSGDIDIIISNKNNDSSAFTAFLDKLIEKNVIIHILSRGKTKSLTIAQLPGKPARRVDLMYSPPDEYAFATLYFTGSKGFNTMQRQRALNLGYTLNEHGFHVMKNKRKGAKVEKDFPDEQSIFKFLGMKYKTPNKRKGARSVELLEEQPALPSKANMENVPDMQDIGKMAAYKQKYGESKVENIIVPPKKKAKTTKNITLKKKPSLSATKMINEFKKQGTSFLNQLLEKGLEKMIVKANKAYYGNKKPVMSDDQYDILREYTLDRFPNNNIAKNGHVNLELEASKNKVKLPYEMWSMDKIKPDTGALTKWKKKYSGPYVLSCKLDGVSGLYSTEGDEPKLYTRGNGKIGQDVSHMIPYMRLPTEKGLVLRGEIIIHKNVFDQKYKEKFSNPRNFVAGVVNQKKIIADKIQDLDFVAYELIKPEMTPALQLQSLSNMNVETVRFLVESDVTNEFLSELLVSWRDDYKYEIDGVICCNDRIYKRSSGNPDHAFAFKMVLSDQIAEVQVVDVIWTPSKDGYLKPRVQVKPVVLGGAKIEYATGFNAKFIKDNNIGVGSVIKLVRSGDVIPHIMEVIRPSTEPMMPNIPYEWNDTNVDIQLINKTENITVQKKVITGFFKGIAVDAMGPGIVNKLVNAGYNTVPKILKMEKQDFLQLEGFKQKLSEKIHTGIHTKINIATLPELMNATNIFGRGFGVKKIKSILSELPDILVSSDSKQEKIDKVKSIDGMAKKTATSFVDKIEKFKLFMSQANMSDKLIYAKTPVSTSKKSHPLYDKRIVMTGFRDKPLVKILESFGAINGTSVSKKTFVVLVKDIDEDTGKAEQARELGITLMTPEMFKEKYNLN